MTDEQKAAFILSQATSAFIEALGMFSENEDRRSRGEGPAYVEKDFFKLRDRHCLGHNSVLEFLHS